MTIARLIIVGCLASAASPVLWAGEAAAHSRQARSIAEAVERLQSLREAARRERETFASRHGELRRQTERLRRELDDLEDEVASIRNEVDRLESRTNEIDRLTQRHRQTIDRALAAVRPAIVETRRRIASGVPYRRASRLARLDGLAADLTDDDPAARAEAAAGLWTLLLDDIALARRIESINEPVHTDDGARRMHAWQVRIGLVQQAFLSEDGGTVGLSEPAEASAWRTGLSPERAGAVRRAVGILRRQQRPTLVPLPLPADPPPGEPAP